MAKKEIKLIATIVAAGLSLGSMTPVKAAEGPKGSITICVTNLRGPVVTVTFPSSFGISLARATVSS